MLSVNDVPSFFEGIDHFVTGSVRFGTQKADSDLDVAIRIFDRDKILGKLNQFSIEHQTSDYNNGFKFTIDSKLINVIPLHEVDYFAWFWSAKMIEIMPERDSFDRIQLHGLHESLNGLVKSMYYNKPILFARNVNTNNYQEKPVKNIADINCSDVPF